MENSLVIYSEWWEKVEPSTVEYLFLVVVGPRALGLRLNFIFFM